MLTLVFIPVMYEVLDRKRYAADMVTVRDVPPGHAAPAPAGD
jgi:hypothetical protein